MDADKTSACGSDILQALARVEAKLDVLIAALAGEEEAEPPELTLDGEPAGVARDPTVPL